MGCASSERKTPEDNRSKMLLEYLKGIDVKEVKEINANGHILKDDSDQ